MLALSTKRLQIVADANIPFVEEYFSEIGRVTLVSGDTIDAYSVKSADVLLVRSITTVDRALLEHSPVSFVATATAGADHIDTRYLCENGISFAGAPGANAESVVEYVFAALLELSANTADTLSGKTVGVVGCGAIGGLLQQRLRSLGARILINDPPLESIRAAAAPLELRSLDSLLSECDVLTLHVPLTDSGAYPTRHLIGREELAILRHNSWLINTSRGGIIDEEALREAMDEGTVSRLVLDVWETEPHPNRWLHARADIATPHIAGYSIDARRTATEMIFGACKAHFLGSRHETNTRSGAQDRSVRRLSVPDVTEPTRYLRQIVHQMYDIRADDLAMRSLLELPEEQKTMAFRSLRQNYPARHFFNTYELETGRGGLFSPEQLTEGLGIRVR